MEWNKKGTNNNTNNNETKKANNNDWQKKVHDKKANVKSDENRNYNKYDDENQEDAE